MNERIKEIRKHFKMNQSEFGSKIGISRDTVASIECGRIEIKEVFLKSICREFSVDYIWLTTGKGQMFIDLETDVLDSIDRILAGENEFHKNLFKTFAQLSEEELVVLENILDKFIEVSKK